MMALGGCLGNRSGLGVNPISAVSFSFTQAFGISFSTTTLVLYCLFIGLQFLLRGRNPRWRDLLQLPFTFVFSAMLEIFDRIISFRAQTVVQGLILLILSIVIIGVGISLSVTMQLVPNPADGLLETLSCKLNKELGLTKNLEDAVCAAIAFFVDLSFGTLWASIGVGTVVSMILLGRIISLFNRFFGSKVLALAGLENKDDSSVSG